MRISNRLLCPLLGVFITLLSFIPSSHAQDYTSNLVGHWKLDETSGTTAVDSTSNGNDGTMYGLDASNDSGSGVIGTSIKLDGNNQTRIAISSAPAIDDLGPFTACVWFNPDTFTNTDSDAEFDILHKRRWVFHLDNVLTTPVLRFSLSTSSSYVRVEGTTTLSTGQWYHGCVVHYGIGTEADLYLNGIEEGTGENAGSGTYGSDVGEELRIGSSNTNIYGGNFPGNVDDIRIYNRTLTANDIASLYQLRAAGTLRYNDDAESLEYYDGNEWIHTGLGSYSPNAVNFGGAGDELIGGSLPTSSTKKMTGSFWMKPYAPTTGKTILRTASSELDILLGSSEKFFIRVDGENSGGADILDMDSDAGLGGTQFRHVLFSVDMSDPTKRHLYIDDVLSENYTTYTDDTFDLGTGSLVLGSSSKITGDMADVWLDMGTYIDFSVEANRRKFISENGMPMMLGENGSLPTGQSPDVFLSGDTDSWHENKGTSGGFTENGALTHSDTNAGKHLLKWEQVGNGVAMASHTTSAIAKLTQNTIAYADSNNNTLTTFSWDGTDWTQVGNDLSVGIGPQTRLTPLNNNTVVEVSGDNGATADNLTTYSWDGTDWTQVGNIFTLPVSSHHAITTLDNTTIAYIGSNDEDITTYSWDGTDWSQVGNVLSLATSIYRPDIDALDSTTIVLNDTGTEGLRTYSWDGTDWSQVGNSFTLADSSEKPAITAINSTTIAMVQDEIMQTYSWDGTDWTAFGQPYTITGAGNTPAIELFSGNTVAFTDNTNDTLQTYQFAFCSAPERTKGTMVFNSTFNLMQYCNGVDWVAMGDIGGTGSGCSDPSGDAGDMIYNDDYNIMQYCDSQNWRGVGKNIYSMLDYGLVGHWPLDETSGSVISDVSGNGNDGSWDDNVNNDVAEETVEGISSDAINFDGTDDVVNVPDSDTLDIAGPLTISFWANIDDFSGISGHNSSYQELVIKWQTGYTTNYLVHTNASQQLCVVQGNSQCTTRTIPQGEWVHVTAVMTSETNTDFYINGAYADSVINGYGPTNSNPLTFGDWQGGGEPLNGKMDDVRIWDRALNAGEVSALYNLYVEPDITTGLVGHWPLDETSGTTSFDSSGNGNDGTMENGLDAGTDSTTGIIGSALTWDNTDDRVNAGSDGTIDDIFIGGGTIAAWVYPITEGEGNYGRILVKGDTGGSNGWHLHMDGNRGESASISVGCSGGGFVWWRLSNGDVPLNQWSHIVVSFNTDVGTNTPSIYINGVSTSYTGGDCSGSGGYASDSGQDLYMGSRSDLNRTFDGPIDDVRMYNRALSGADITLLYNTSQSNLSAGLVGHWKLDETTGTTAIDSSGNGNDGSMTGGLDAGSNSTTGALAGALSFDGSNDITQLPNLLVSEDPEPISVCAWFNADSLHNGTIWNYAAQGFTNFDRVITLGVKSSGVAFSGKEDQDAESSSTYSVGTWNHVCGIFTNGGNRTIYFNGVFEGTDTSSRGSNNLDRMAIGARWGTTSDRFFDGNIDDVRIYNRALSASDVQALYDDPCDDSPAIGDICRDGSYYAGLTPDGSVPMYMADATSQVAGTAWSSAYSVTGFTSLTDGDGNTAGLVALGDAGAPYPAAVYCDALDAHGHQDWYLPARDEMDLIYNGGVQIGNVETAGIAYWSSTESSVTHSWQTYFGNGVQNDWSSKLNGKYVRCVRKD